MNARKMASLIFGFSIVSMSVALMVHADLPPPGSDLLISSFGAAKVARYNANTATYLGDFATGVPGGYLMSAQAPTGYVFVASYTTDAARRYDVDGNLHTTYSTSGKTGARSVEYGPDGNVYVAYDNGGSDGEVRKYSLLGADMGVFTSGYTFDTPMQITFNGGFMYMSDYGNGLIKRFSAATGVYDPTWSASAGLPTSIAFMPTGTDFLAINYGDVHRYNAAGTSLGLFASFGLAFQIAYGPDGNLYGNDTAHEWVVKTDGASGGAVTTFFGAGGGIGGGRGLAFVVPEPSTAVLLSACGFLVAFARCRK